MRIMSDAPETFDRRDLRDTTFTGTDLRGARFIETDLSGAVLRGVEFRGVEIDSPWLFEGDNTLLVNGIDVLPYVDAELDRRFPGRSERRASDPEGLRQAWAKLETAWAAALERAASMPAGTVDEQVAGEWSFAETLRHLILATDTWLRRAVLHIEPPFHPYGLAVSDPGDANAPDPAQFTTERPAYADVLEVRAGRQAMVSDYVASVTAAELDAEQRNPWAPQYPETTRSCLHVILQEEWEHLRYALRDLEVVGDLGLLDSRPSAEPT